MSKTLPFSPGVRPTEFFVAMIVAAMLVLAMTGDASAHPTEPVLSASHGYDAPDDAHHDGRAAGALHCHASASCAFVAIGVEAVAADRLSASIGLRLADLDASGLIVPPENPPPIHW